jgi:hypothetical protein
MLSALKAISAAYEGSGGPFFLGPKPSYADFHWFPWAHRLAPYTMMLNSGVSFNPGSTTQAWCSEALPRLLRADYS